MKKKEISEIKKTLNFKKGCRIDTIATVYQHWQSTTSIGATVPHGRG